MGPGRPSMMTMLSPKASYTTSGECVILDPVTPGEWAHDGTLPDSWQKSKIGAAKSFFAVICCGGVLHKLSRARPGACQNAIELLAPGPSPRAVARAAACTG